jgi:hypothetical protein
MKSIPMLMLVMTLQPTAAGAAGEALATLEPLRWAKRIFLVYGPAPGTDHAVEHLESFAAGIEDRQVAWFVLGDGRLRTNHEGPIDASLEEHLRNRYFSPAPNGPVVVLIGKDGEVKSRRPELDLDRLFAQIDSMPMRQREMRDAGNRLRMENT